MRLLIDVAVERRLSTTENPRGVLVGVGRRRGDAPHLMVSIETVDAR